MGNQLRFTDSLKREICSIEGCGSPAKIGTVLCNSASCLAAFQSVYFVEEMLAGRSLCEDLRGEPCWTDWHDWHARSHGDVCFADCLAEREQVLEGMEIG